MDRDQLIETTAHSATDDGGDGHLTPADVEHVLDSLFGTVEHPGSIAEALARGESVVLGSFGRFRRDGGTAAFHPGTALTEFLQHRTG